MPRKKEESAEEIQQAAAPESTDANAAGDTQQAAEASQAEGTPTEQIASDAAPEPAAENSADASAAPTPDETPAASEEPSIISSVLGTVASAASTVADTVVSAATTVTDAIGLTGGEKKETGRGNRAERVGTVTSDKMTKTVVVRVDRLIKHPKYRRYVRRKKQFMAHDETGATIGDKVRIVETRPLSARKRWRVVEIVQKAAK
jgi:small subunit ribosomal protein S17